MTQKYRLNSLGWYNFERLIQSLLKAAIGVGVVSFGGTCDKGRDATFRGSANYPSETTKWSGYWIFQVKFIDYEEFPSDRAQSRLRNELCDEIKKIIKRKHKPDNYILITNISVSAENRDKLAEIAINCGFIENYATIDGEEVCQLLDQFPEIRRTYPQLLGISDLHKLIAPEIFARSKNYYNFWAPQMRKFVQTEAYVNAMNTLKNHHFVVIDGPPEVGKSMIAAACAFVYATDGYQIDSISDPKDLLRIRGLDELGNHLFIADDAVGPLSYSPGLAEQWSQEFLEIFGSLESKNKLIWTTRRYILSEAIQKSRIGDKIEKFPGIHEILVEVSKLSKLQKAEILYNHAKNGTLNSSAKKIVKENAENIVKHPNFTPERIRQLTNDFIPSFYCSDQTNAILTWEKIQAFLKNPSEHWKKAYDQLQVSEKKLLSAMLDFENFAKLSDLKNAYQLRITQSDDNVLTFEECLDRLDHSFLKLEINASAGKTVLFQHPSLRDLLLIKIQANDKKLLEHIGIASPTAIAEIVRGFAKTYKEQENIAHLISIRTDEQFAALLTRIDNFSQIILTQNDWNSILAALDVLVPSELYQKLASSEQLNLTQFSRTKEHEIIRRTLIAFGKMSTYEKCKIHPFHFWIRTLTKFYYLSYFVNQPIHIEYLYSFPSRSDISNNEELELDFIVLVAKYEPIFYSKIKSQEKINSIHEYIKTKIEEKIEEGTLFEKGDQEDLPNIKYEDWKSETDNLLAFEQTFKNFTHLADPDEEMKVKTLENLFYSVSSPEPEPDPDIYYDTILNEDYWTISKIFEDL